MAYSDFFHHYYLPIKIYDNKKKPILVNLESGDLVDVIFPFYGPLYLSPSWFFTY